MLKNIKAIAADIDGTLVSKGDAMMPITCESLIRLHNEGVLLGLATGRAVSSGLLRRYKDWGLPFQFDFFIGINGGQLLDPSSSKIQNFHMLDGDTIREILDFMRPLNLPAQFYEGDNMVVTKIDEMVAASMARNHTPVIDLKGDESYMIRQPNNNLIFRYDVEKEEEVMAHIAAHPSDKYSAVITFPGIVEFMDPRVTKGTGLQHFGKNMSITMDEIIAFGDMDNDIELLKEAGLGVCLKNGSDATKAAADVITEYPCTEDGMGRYIYIHILKEEIPKQEI